MFDMPNERGLMDPDGLRRTQDEPLGSATGPEMDVSDSEYEYETGPGSPYDVSGQTLKQITARARYDLYRAKARKTSLNARAKYHRKILDLESKSPAYEGAPDITLPLMRSKRDGVVAHLTDALDVEPFFSAEGLTEEAAEVAPIWEALMERELNASDGKERYLMALREAVDVGTATIGWSIALGPDGEPLIQETLTRFENFYAYPVAVDDFTNCSTFRRYKEPWFILKEMADSGMLSAECVEDLHQGGGSGEEITWEEARDGDRDGEFSPDQELHELWECYVRWEGELWRVVFSERLNKALSVKRNPFREAFDAPPFEPLRVIRKPGYVWGHSVPMLLEAIQKIMDNAEISRMAYNQFAISPIIMADRMNPFTRQLAEGGVAPGMVIQTIGSPDVNGVRVLEMPKPDITIEDQELAQRFADMATFTDFQVEGAPFASSRRTATEVRTSFNVGTLKLRRMLMDLRADLTRAAKKRWALIELFKVRPKGVLPLYREGKQYLLSDEGVSEEEMGQLLVAWLQAEGPVDPMMLEQERQSLASDYQLVSGGIPSVKRDDVRWVPNGTDIIPDKVAELQKLDGFAPFLSMLELAQQDERIWYFLKTRLQLMGRHDWRKFVGENPRVRMENQQYMEAMQMAMQQSGQIANSAQGGR